MYKDYRGYEYSHLSRLCEANGIDYKKCYYLVHNKGMSSEEASMILSEKGVNGSGESTKEENYKISGIYPSVEYRKYLGSQLFTLKKRLNTAQNELAMVSVLNSIERINGTINKIESAEFFFQLYDNISIGNEDFLNSQPREMVEMARSVYDNATDGLMRDIYEDFSKEYSIGKYSSKRV